MRFAATVVLIAVSSGGGATIHSAERADRPLLNRDDAVGERAVQLAPASRPYGFYFTRAAYSSGGRRRWGSAWQTDFPKADQQFVSVLQRLVDRLDVFPAENAVRLDDPNLRRYPFLYAVEVGQMELTEAEVLGLRSYILAGGFLMVDDFWGTYEWMNFEQQIRRVLPDYPIVEITPDHPMLSTYYTIDEIVQVPAINNWRCCRRTSERDGYTPHARAIFDERGRMLVAINFNTDLGDAWEWAEQPDYPLDFSTYAMQMAANTIVYSMSH